MQFSLADAGSVSNAGYTGFGFAGYTSTATSGSSVAWDIAATFNQSSGTAANTLMKLVSTETQVGSGSQYSLAGYGGSAGTTQLYYFGNINYGALVTGTAVGFEVPANTYTVTGTSTVATMGGTFLGATTFPNAGAGTITQAATLVVGGPAVAAGSQLVTTTYDLLLAGGGGIGIGGAPAANLGAGMVQHLYNSFATAGQQPSATTRTLVTGSHIHFAAGQLQVGTILHWQMDITKTGAGTATSVFDIAFGTNGTTGDTAQVSFTKPAGTAQADHCIVIIEAVVKTNSSSGVVLGNFTLCADQTSATLGGFLAAAKYNSSLTTTSGTFNTTTPTDAEICITTGTSDVYTINECTGWADNL